MKYDSLLRNPLTLWMKWVISKIYYEQKYKKQHLVIGYMSSFLALRGI